MKNIQFTPRTTDLAMLSAGLRLFSIIGCSLLAGIFLENMLNNVPNYECEPVEVMLSAPVALFVWSLFRVIEPVRHGWNWTIAKFMIVPAVWLLLMLTLHIWFQQNSVNSGLFGPLEIIQTGIVNH